MLICLITEAASLPASDERRTAGDGRFALAESAIVLVHDELAMKVALDLGANPFVVCGVQGGDIRRRITRYLTGAHGATVLVLDEVAL